MNPLFSIIVACCDVEQYLDMSLGSVSRQTNGDFEAICYVEDSTDDSLAVCRRMAERDSRFKVVTAPRSGAVATTRNYGIAHAAGEYLVVLDGDDWIVPEMLEKLSAKLARTGSVDVMAFAGVSTELDGAAPPDIQPFSNFAAADADSVFSGLEAIRRAGRNGGGFRNYTWLNIYRTAFLRENGIRQTDGVLMEDFESTPRIWFAARTFAYLDEALYVYRRRPRSLTTDASGRIAVDVARQFRSLAEFAVQRGVRGDIMAIWSNQWLSTLYWFLFHPVTSRKVSDAERGRALDALFADGGAALLRGISGRASLPKRVAMHFVRLAAHGWQWPAKMFFRRLYYPLNGWLVRNAVRKGRHARTRRQIDS